jgi:hypothetical protein
MSYHIELRPYKAKFTEPTGYSFNLNEDMLAVVAEEFAPEDVAGRLAEAIKGKSREEIPEIARKFFSEFGPKWIRRCYQLGDEYPDRTYEIIRESSDRTGEFVFPFLGQRAIEIAYLGTQGLVFLPVEINNSRQLVYRVENCKYSGAIKEKCGAEVADPLYCRQACLSAAETVFADLDKKVMAEMLAETPKEGYCRFSVSKI